MNSNSQLDLQPDSATYYPETGLGDAPVRRLTLEESRLVLISPPFEKIFPSYRIKRVIDLVVAAAMIIVLSPVILFVALAIAFDFEGQIIYRSERVGRRGVTFPCLKFRTMHVDADQRKKEIEHLNERDGVFFKVSNDPRVTAIGGFLRRYSLDELPQLWNVIRGDMSLVGPRPPLPEEYAAYTHAQRSRLSVTPGLTGMWQVYARRHPSFATCLRYDRHYIENWSLALDLKLLLLTIPAVFNGTGE